MAQGKVKHPGGRPTVVTDELIAQANAYVYNCEVNGTLPTVEQLAYELKVARSTIYENDQFSDTLEQLKQIQAHMLIANGLMGTYNSTIAKLLLSSAHGYVEKQAVEHSGGNPVELLLKRYNLMEFEPDSSTAAQANDRQNDDPVSGPSESPPQD